MRPQALVLALALLACKASVPEGRLACTADTQCPNHWQCLSGIGQKDHCFSSVEARDRVVMQRIVDAGHDGGSPRVEADAGTGQDGATADPCASQNGGCDALVDCSANGSLVTCGACPTGYDDTHGDGTLCTDVDECAQDNGGCGDAADYKCTNNAGATPTCLAVEHDCFNGKDDNGDGLTDCADPDCSAGAVCVDSADGFEVGELIDAAESCPEGMKETAIYQGLTSDSVCWDGCSCTPDPVTCGLQLYSYPVGTTSCADDLYLEGGTLEGDPVTTACIPNQSPVASGSYSGWRTGPMLISQSCKVTGTPSAPPPAQWSQAMKFCAAQSVGGGCSGNQVCVAAAATTDTQCALSSGIASCSGYAVAENDWYTGTKDTRTCGACDCVAQDASCEGVTVTLGNDWSCNASPITLGESDQYCFTSTDSSYSPVAGLSQGNRTDPTCTASAPITGTLSGTGRQTLCCKPK